MDDSKDSYSMREKKNPKIQDERKVKSLIINSNEEQNLDSKDKFLTRNLIQYTIRNVNPSLPTQSINPTTKMIEGGVWKLIEVFDKNKLKGTKAIVEWIYSKTSTRISIKVILSEAFLNKTSNKDFFVELNSSNIKLNFKEQKEIQQIFDKTLEDNKNNYSKDILQFQKTGYFQWLKDVMIKAELFFLNQKFYSRPILSNCESFNQHLLSSDFMPFPSQACLSWSPHHYLCVVEEKPIQYSKPIRGTLHSMKTLLQNLNRNERFARKTEQDEIEGYQIADEELEETNIKNSYEWDFEQEIKFVVFKGLQPLHEGNSLQKKVQRNIEENQNIEEKMNPVHEVTLMNNTSSLGPMMLSLLRKNMANANYEKIPRLTKIKIYMSVNNTSRIEDNIIYLHTKIQEEYDGSSICKVLMKKQFRKSLKMFNIESFSRAISRIPFFPGLEYQTIRRVLRKKINKASCHNLSLLYMKGILLENEYLHSMIENYFIKALKTIKIKSPVNILSKIGSYMHFDQALAQNILFFILENYLIIKFGTLDFNSKQASNEHKRQRDLQENVKNLYIGNPFKYDHPASYKIEKRQIKQKVAKIRHQSSLNSNKGNSEANIEEQSSIAHDKQSSNQKKLSLSKQQSSKIQTKIKLEQNKETQRNELSENGEISLTKNPNCNNIPSYVMQIYQLCPLEFKPILRQQERDRFLKEQLIPTLINFNQNLQGPQQILIKKSLIANVQIIKFTRKMDLLITDFNNKKFTEIRDMIVDYRKHTNLKPNYVTGEGSLNFRGYCKTCNCQIAFFNLKTLINNQFKESNSDHKIFENSPFIKSFNYCEECRAIPESMPYFDLYQF